jgi:hypothetical protein
MDKYTRTNLVRLLGVLITTKATYSITLPDGHVYKSADFDPKPNPVITHKRKARYPRGFTYAYYVSYFEGKGKDDHILIPCGDINPKVLASNISAYTTQTFGAGKYATSLNHRENRVEVLLFGDRIK